MNGVRRLLGGGGGGSSSSSPPSQPELPLSTAPLSFAPKSGPTWPPSSPGPALQAYPESPKTTQALFLKKDRTKSSSSSPSAQAPAAFDSDQPATTSTPNSNGSYYSRQSTGTAALRTSRNTHGTPSPTRSQTLPPSPAVPSPRGGSMSTTARASVRKSGNTDLSWKRSSGNLDTRDELLISLMASEAVIDSRQFNILTAEEVDELKKEYQVLGSRQEAMTKKLALETKIRDAALSLSKVNAAHKKVSKQTSEQLEAANKRVDTAQRELYKVSDRVAEVHRRLMEHRAAVLSFSVRTLEKKIAPPPSEDSGYDSNRSTLISPTMSTTQGLASPASRFDGAHLFAGHADTIVPRRQLSAEAAMSEITMLEEKLKEAKDNLANAGKKQVEMARELSMLQLEKQEVETMMGMDLQAAEETIAAMEKEIPRLEELDNEVKDLRVEKEKWQRERESLREQAEKAQTLQARLADQESKTGEAAGSTERILAELRQASQRELETKDAQIQRLKEGFEHERAEWDQERRALEDAHLEDLARLNEEVDRVHEEDEATMQAAQEEVRAGLAALQALISAHGIVLFARDASLQGLLNAVGVHLDAVHVKLDAHAAAEAGWDGLRRKLEEDVRAGLDKREDLARELEEARKERDAAKRETLTMESQAKRHMRAPSAAYTPLPASVDETADTDAARIISALQPLWAILPSPEARAAKFGANSTRSFRTGSPTPTSPSTSTANGSVASSLSDLDVRSLKTLYKDGANGTPMPMSPRTVAGGNGNSAPFSVEAFAARVQALVADDRALIERLMRFAQAHDLLKKNAERAQKLAQDGTHALETYQKQVRALEERNAGLASKNSAMQDELNLLHDTIERLTNEKRELERLAAEQAEECAQLTDANNALSARTLSLAEEAAQAPERVRKQLEAQLAEMKKDLELAQDEVEAMRTSEQSQRIALLDELNSMQTENGSLRAQLRAAKK
ncbi:hypothetical protein BDN70DRAFT_930562 [Pholiota conissans]|uniref:Up-regulated during septation protein 1 domain-containing protein n=1 Tax=Pholiota conissans TaxID=109636 RepID=A0A9P6D2X2_9AGAR|nr:hypothetical protein BDN70DRAFT_930562 [Pholiota conissans]